MEQNCIRCKRLYQLLVPLRPVAIQAVGGGHTNYRYVCSCGCCFERTVPTPADANPGAPMKSLTVYGYGREQRQYINLTQERLDALLDEWEFPGSVIDCDDAEIDWTIIF